MKKQMSLVELNEYFREKPASCYTYATDGQDWAKNALPFWFALSFQELLASGGTRSVLLKTDSAFVLFQDVESAEVDDTETIIGPTIRLRCGPDSVEHLVIAVR